jgi:hypothetical protein
MEVVFHIGTNKTGTSAIQGFLDSNPDYLRSIGYVYPVAGRGTEPSHVSLAHATAPLLQTLVSDIEKEAQDNGRVIISSEYLHTIDPSHILDAFGGHTIRTVVFLRDHVSYFSSWYREAIKSENKTFSLWDFATLVTKPYHTWLHRWPNLTVVHYDRETLLNNSAVDHFINLLDPQAPTPPKYQDMNPSISGNLLFAKQVLNNFITREQILSFRPEFPILRRINPTFSGPMQIPEHVFEYIVNKYEYDQYVIEERYGIPLSPSSDSMKGSPTPNLDTLRQDLSQIMEYSNENGLDFGKHIARVFFE